MEDKKFNGVVGDFTNQIDYSFVECDFNDRSIFETAKLCVESEDIEGCWLSLLECMLKHWNAEIEMDLGVATDLCMSATNILNENYDEDIFHYSLLPNSYKHFWYIDKSPITAMRIYRITIALFESINYWCWHDSPIPVTFNEASLFMCLEYPIKIEWEKYDGFLSDWIEQNR